MRRNNLKSSRHALGITQAKLAELVGIGESHYQTLEYGKCEPRLTLAIRLSKALGVSVEDLFSLPGEEVCKES